MENVPERFNYNLTGFSRGLIGYAEGDIIDFAKAVGGTIVHQVNCKKAAGRGLAARISKEWPEWLAYYKQVTPELGIATVFPVYLYPLITVASLYSQDDYGQDRRYTDYDAFEACLIMLNDMRPVEPVIVPYKIGCGLGGGDWSIVNHILMSRLDKYVMIRKDI